MKRLILKQIKKKKAREMRERHGADRARRHTTVAVRQARVGRQEQQRQSAGRQRLMGWLRGDGLAVLGIVVLVCSTVWYFGIANERFVLNDISVSSLEFLEEEEVRGAVDEVLQSRSLIGVRRNTYWTLRPETLQNGLWDRLGGDSGLESLTVEKQWPNAIAISIDERVPAIEWVTTRSGELKRYLIDRDGVVTQSLVEGVERPENLPVIFDVNRASLEPGWQVVSAEFLDFALQVHSETEPLTGLAPQELHFPEVVCKERQVVTEQIFEQEILETASDEFRERKRDIQELFQQGVLSIDESLAELEAVKREEIERLGEIQEDEGAVEKLAFEEISVDVECDLVVVGHRLNVIVQDASQNNVEIYLDSTEELQVQLENAITILQNPATSIDQVEYVDVRIPDRAYYR